MHISRSILFTMALGTLALACRTASGESESKDAPSVKGSDSAARAAAVADVPADAGVFRYDESDGKCKDASGVVGFNNLNFEMFNTGRGGECGKFTGVGIINATAISDCNGHAPCTLDGWNFRGADLDTLLASGGPYCGLNFEHADLRGARLDKLAVLYTCIEGLVDDFTVIPTSVCGTSHTMGCCVTGDRIKCVK